MDRINFIIIKILITIWFFIVTVSKIILYIPNLIAELIMKFLVEIYLIIRRIERENTINKRYILITLIRKFKFKNKYIKKELAKIRYKKIKEKNEKKEVMREIFETLKKQKNNNLGGINNEITI